MTTLQQTVRVRKPLGLHVKPAAELSRIVSNFDAMVALSKGEKSVDAHSVVDLITLGVYDGDELRISAIGNEAREAIEAVMQLLMHPADVQVVDDTCMV